MQHPCHDQAAAWCYPQGLDHGSLEDRFSYAMEAMPEYMSFTNHPCKLVMGKSGSVQFITTFGWTPNWTLGSVQGVSLNPELDPWFSSGGFLEPWTEPLVQVQGGPVQVQKGFKREPNMIEDLRVLAYVIIKNEHSFCARYHKGVNALWGISQKTVFIAMYKWNLSP